jgi:hypothetical protein
MESSRGNCIQAKGQNIRGTNIVDLLQYTVLPYNAEIPEPAGRNIFLKGLAKLEIDKNLIVSGRVVKADFHCCVFRTQVHARKTLNPSIF